MQKLLSLGWNFFGVEILTKPSDQRQIRIREDAAPAAAATDIVVVDDPGDDLTGRLPHLIQQQQVRA